MKKENALRLTNVRVAIEDKKILRGVTLTVKPGKVHVIMGPNGSGKSTLAGAIMGHPLLTVTGSLSLDGKSITRSTPAERARRGLFLAFQSPVAIPGVSVVSILRESLRARREAKTSISKKTINPAFRKKGSVELAQLILRIKTTAKELGMSEDFLTRGIHDGFSGGERKKMEMLEALVLMPSYAVFDEIDTGLDVDSLRIVAHGIFQLAQEGTGVLVITHYRRITEYLPADRVHILVDGKIVKEGTRALISVVERSGYRQFAS